MIKFFRNIRKALLSENKFNKYLIYAIGEIILVVIGILIALQINNWNETNKRDNEAKKLLASIKTDLAADIEHIQQFLNVFEEEQASLEQQSQYLSSPDFPLDSLVDFAQSQINLYVYTFPGFSSSAYNSAKSSGKIEILEANLKRELFEHYLVQEAISSSFETYTNIHIEETRQLINQYPISFPFNYVKGGQINELMWSNVDQKQLSLSLSSWGSSKLNLYRIIMEGLTAISTKTKSTLELIEDIDD